MRSLFIALLLVPSVALAQQTDNFHENNAVIGEHVGYKEQNITGVPGHINSNSTVQHSGGWVHNVTNSHSAGYGLTEHTQQNPAGFSINGGKAFVGGAGPGNADKGPADRGGHDGGRAGSN